MSATNNSAPSYIRAGQSPAPRRGEAAAIEEGHTPDEDEESAYLADDQVGCGGCFLAVLFISSVDLVQNCEGSLSRDKFLL